MCPSSLISMSFIVAPSRGLGLGCFLDRLDLDGQLDLVADDHAAGLQREVPGEPEVLAIDRRSRREAGAQLSPHVLLAAGVVDLENDLAGRAADGEVARDAQAARARLLDALAGEGHVREVLGVEE